MSETRTVMHSAIEQVVRACLARLDEPELDLAVLADEAGYSPFHFHRIFTAMTGEGPAALIRRLRLERAAKEMQDEAHAPLARIALAAGYSTTDAFTRAFRQAFGMPPSEYRRLPSNHRLPSVNGIHYGYPLVLTFRSYGDQPMETKIEQRPAYHVVGLAHKGAYWMIGRTFGQVAQWAKENGVDRREAIAVFHDDPEKVPEAELRSDALVTVSEPFPATEGMVSYTIPAGKYLVGLHEGSYEKLPQAWGKFYAEELPQSGGVVRDGLVYERYINDCNVVPEAELLTELLIPVN